MRLQSKWLRDRFPNVHNYCLEALDLRGAHDIGLDRLAPILSSCVALNSVVLPDSFFESAEVTSRRFWDAAFSKAKYTRGYDAAVVKERLQEYRKSKIVVVDTRKSSLAEDMGIKKSTKNKQQLKKGAEIMGFPILEPHPLHESFRYRDQYVRRRLLENESCRTIQKSYRVHRVWNRFKYSVRARQIANTYKIILDRRKFMLKLNAYTRNRAARFLQRFFYHR